MALLSAKHQEASCSAHLRCYLFLLVRPYWAFMSLSSAETSLWPASWLRRCCRAGKQVKGDEPSQQAFWEKTQRRQDALACDGLPGGSYPAGKVSIRNCTHQSPVHAGALGLVSW